MATEEKEAGGEQPKKSKKTLFVIIGVVLVLILGGTGAFFAMGGGSKKNAEGEESEGDEEEGADEHGAGGGHGALGGAIVPLDPFIVNLQVKGSFLKTVIQLEFSEPSPPHGMEGEMPRIRDGVIRVLSSKQAQDILSVDGKERLKEELKAAINGALGSEEVVNVFFTEFIVQ
jgi:flagellar FliL protein